MLKMFDIKNVWLIVKKELKSYFDSPTAYIALIAFLLLLEFLFFRSVFLAGQASLGILFSFLPWLFLLLIPSLTMGSISQEKSQGTLEFLLTHPVKDIEVILGKFLASFLFVAITLAFIFPIAASLANFGNLDWGIVAGQYLAALSLASLFIALGIFISSLLASQIPALLLSVVGIFFLLVLGSELVTLSLPGWLGSFLERLSGYSHFSSMARGVLDLRDIWYFLSMPAVFLGLALWQLFRRRYGSRKILYRSFRVAVISFIAVVLALNVFSYLIPGRIDLTEGRLYTVTKATKNILANLPDKVDITLYVSGGLPAQVQPILRETKDILQDYKTYGKGKIAVSYKNPSKNSQLAQEAKSLGIQEVQFNVVGDEEFKVKNGYFGLVVSKEEEKAVIPIIQNLSDIEYQLTSFIRQLTLINKKKIVFLAGHEEKSPFQDYGFLSQELQKQFNIEEFSFSQATTTLPKDTDVLVVAGPKQNFDGLTQAGINEYLGQGNNALFLLDAVDVNPNIMTAEIYENNFLEIFTEYGVTVEPDLVYDLRSKETVRFQNGFMTYFLPYSFWPKVISEGNSLITSRLQSMVMPWSSSITLDKEKLEATGFEASVLFATTKFGGRQIEEFLLAPDQSLPSSNLSSQVMAVSLIGQAGEDDKEAPRLVIVGDSDFLGNSFVSGNSGNLAFGMEIISWLAQEESLAGIQLKQKQNRDLLFENNTQKTMVKYGNLGIAFMLPAVFGVIRFLRRRSLRKFTFNNFN